MPTSRRRRTEHRPRDRARLRARARAGRRAPITGPVSTAQFLDLAAAIFPGLPTCPGPVLVHDDDSFECHGPDCPGGTRAHHRPDVVHPCQDHPELIPYAACHRCAREPRGRAAGPRLSGARRRAGLQAVHQLGRL